MMGLPPPEAATEDQYTWSNTDGWRSPAWHKLSEPAKRVLRLMQRTCYLLQVGPRSAFLVYPPAWERKPAILTIHVPLGVARELVSSGLMLAKLEKETHNCWTGTEELGFHEPGDYYTARP